MRFLIIILVTILGSTPALAQDCKDWDKMVFWYGATPQIAAGCVASGADINARDAGGRTALHNTIIRNESAPTLVETLIDLGANVNARDNKGRAPLHANAAAFNGPKATHRITELLINAGADPKPRDNYGLTPWFYDLLPTCGNYFLPCLLTD